MKIRKFFRFLMRNIDLTATTAVIVILTATIATTTYVIAAASDTTELTQTISSGSLSVGFIDSGLNPVDPTTTFGAIDVPVKCLTTTDRPTAELGTSSQMIYVTNPGATTGAWVVNLSATDGEAAVWEDVGQTVSYDFNDTTTSGCGDGADDDLVAGQMQVDPSGATIDVGECQGCTTTNVSVGAGGSFDQGVTDSIPIFNGAVASDDVGDWLIFGIDLYNTIPAQQDAAAYLLDMTVDVTGT